jgi:oxaloacetate decarboxylase alpha subunit
MPEAGSGETVPSPVAGTVIEVCIQAGATVTEGETVAVLESMKMEVMADAPIDGVLTRLDVSEGDVVAEGDPLFAVTPQ